MVFGRFYSKWIPGDFLGGSSGPPILFGTDPEEEEAEDNNSVAASIGQDSLGRYRYLYIYIYGLDFCYCCYWLYYLLPIYF